MFYKIRICTRGTSRPVVEKILEEMAGGTIQDERNTQIKTLETCCNPTKTKEATDKSRLKTKVVSTTRLDKQPKQDQ